MEIYGSIYGLRCTCHPEDGIRYVGQTKQRVSERLAGHRRLSRHGVLPSYRWIQKHGEENIYFEVLDTAMTREELMVKEILYIDKHETFASKNGLNLTRGGEGHFGQPTSDETKRKLSAAAKGRIQSPEWIEKRASASRGLKRSEELKARWSESAKKRDPRTVKRGSEHGMAKLTEDQVRAIRVLGSTDMLNREIADRFNISREVVGRIKNRKVWVHV